MVVQTRYLHGYDLSSIGLHWHRTLFTGHLRHLEAKFNNGEKLQFLQGSETDTLSLRKVIDLLRFCRVKSGDFLIVIWTTYLLLAVSNREYAKGLIVTMMNQDLLRLKRGIPFSELSGEQKFPLLLFKSQRFSDNIGVTKAHIKKPPSPSFLSSKEPFDASRLVS